MALTVKMTFTLAERIDRTAWRLGLPKSGVVREAVAEYSGGAGRLSDAERERMLSVFDDVIARPSGRPRADADREIAEVRRARRDTGRKADAKRKK